MNTRISYLYRDADNYKQHNEAVVAGEITQSQINTIMGALDEQEYFIPHQVGLPEKRFEETTCADHAWFELPQDAFESVDAEPTVDITVEDLAAAFQRAAGYWVAF